MKATDVALKIEDAAVVAGTKDLIPITLMYAGTDSLLAYELTAECDPEVLELDGIEEAGTLTEGWMEADNESVGEYSHHKMKVAVASATPMKSQTGVLVFIKAKILKDSPTNTIKVTSLTLNETVIAFAPTQNVIEDPTPAPTVDNAAVMAKLDAMHGKLNDIAATVNQLANN